MKNRIHQGYIDNADNQKDIAMYHVSYIKSKKMRVCFLNYLINKYISMYYIVRPLRYVYMDTWIHNVTHWYSALTMYPNLIINKLREDQLNTKLINK
jgi:hypothetical protein